MKKIFITLSIFIVWVWYVFFLFNLFQKEIIERSSWETYAEAMVDFLLGSFLITLIPVVITVALYLERGNKK